FRVSRTSALPFESRSDPSNAQGRRWRCALGGGVAAGFPRCDFTPPGECGSSASSQGPEKAMNIQNLRRDGRLVQGGSGRGWIGAAVVAALIGGGCSDLLDVTLP